MSEVAERIREHYARAEGDSDLLARVNQILNSMGDEPVTTARLAGLDQFHIRGLAATAELAELAAVQSSMKVLDAGSGLGGPSRFLAERYGCRVVGVDLTPEYVAVSKLLAERMGLNDLVTYEVADLTALPFPDSQFDLVWTQHVVMNIKQRAAMYNGFRRVLKLSGKLVFYDILAADGKPELTFPVPWATTSDTSFLLTKGETLHEVESTGFKIATWNDVTAEALAWFQEQLTPSSPPPLARVLGTRFGGMMGNMVRNMREGKICVVMGVCDAV